MESLNRPPTSLSNLLSVIPLILEVSRLRVPVVDFIWDCVKGHDPLHEQGRDSSGEETDQDIVVRDTGMSGVTLKCQNITFERGGELPILLCHVMGGQPGNGIPSCILVLKGQLEPFKKVVPGSKGNSGAIDGILLEGVGPGQGRSFSHV